MEKDISRLIEIKEGLQQEIAKEVSRIVEKFKRENDGLCPQYIDISIVDTTTLKTLNSGLGIDYNREKVVSGCEVFFGIEI